MSVKKCPECGIGEVEIAVTSTGSCATCKYSALSDKLDPCRMCYENATKANQFPEWESKL